MEDPGIFCLRDVWLGLEKNWPKELKDLHTKYLDEISENVKSKWQNREKVELNVRVLKEWFVSDWQNLDPESLSDKIVQKLVKHVLQGKEPSMNSFFADILNGPITNDRIHTLKVAKVCVSIGESS